VGGVGDLPDQRLYMDNGIFLKFTWLSPFQRFFFVGVVVLGGGSA